MGISFHDIAHALGVGTQSTSNVSAGGTTTAGHSGSSVQPPKGTAATTKSSVSVVTSGTDCGTTTPSHNGLSSSSVPELRKLAQYERVCRGGVMAKVSFFVPTPATIAQAKTDASVVSATLKAFDRAGVEPLVFMEPVDMNGTKLDLSKYSAGAYDDALETYFASIQGAGITGDQMGTWVFLPEGNLPLWSTVDPSIYGQVVTKTATMMKNRLPGSRAALMLDSQSYPVGGSWGQGKYVSLLPYVQNFPPGLIDSFGLQGFPWAAPAKQAQGNLYDPHVYLRSDFAVEAARALHVSTVWLNTGTFGRMYANQPGATVALTALDRQAMLNGVLEVANQVKSKGFTTAVHLFAQNKADLDEGTDWSYWGADPATSAATPVFTTFMHNASAKGIGTWLYDADTRAN